MNRFFFNRRSFFKDLVAGLTLGIESIPDGMATGLLAAVNPIHGVYAYMYGTFTGALFTSSVFMAVQTPSAMALIVAGVPQVRRGEYMLESLAALTILTGIFVVFLGWIRIGRFLRFLSHSVMVGFISGIGVLTILGQLDNLTGYAATGANRVLKTINLFFNLHQVDLPTFFVGIVTILAIVNLEKTRLKSLGMVAAIFLASLLPPLFNWDSIALVSDIAEIPSLLPWPILPPLSVFPDLIIPAISLALVVILQGAGVSKNYPNPDGQYPDPDKDFIGQGISNIVTGIFQGIPVSGSFSATALSVNSGARTRLANLSAGVTMAAILLLFGNAISYLALPALGGLLIVVGYRIIKQDDIRMVWKIGPIQQTVMLITFGLTLLIPLQYAVFTGIALSILMFVFHQSNKINVVQWIRQPGELPLEKEPPQEVPPEQVLVLTPYGSLFFAAVVAFEKELPNVTEETNHSVVILNLRQRSDLGGTFLSGLERYASDLQQQNSRLMLTEISDQVMDQFNNTGYTDIFGWDNLYQATDRVFESILEAQYQAEKWIEEQK